MFAYFLQVRPVGSERQVIVFIGESFESFTTNYLKNADSFWDEASDCLYEWVIE